MADVGDETEEVVTDRIGNLQTRKRVCNYIRFASTQINHLVYQGW